VTVCRYLAPGDWVYLAGYSGGLKVGPGNRAADLIVRARADGAVIVTGGPPVNEPLLARRQLGRLLRQLRESAAITQEALAATRRWSPSKVRRIEAGRTRPSVDVVRTLLHHYGLDDSTLTARLTQLVDAGTTQCNRLPTGMPRSYGAFIAFERAATQIRVFNPLNIPGLLQTADVAARMAARYVDDTERARKIAEIRLQRQSDVLDRDDPPDVEVIISEGVLQSTVGDNEIMRRQITHLATLAQRPSLSIHVIPLRSHPMVTNGPFILLRFGPDAQSCVYIEGPLIHDFFDHDKTVNSYEAAFQHHLASAFGPEESLLRIQDLAKQMNDSTSPAHTA